jgi:hypothetical protein
MYETMNEKQLGDCYVAEMKARVLAQENVEITLDVGTAASVFAILQLALRHPGLIGNVAAVHVRVVAAGIQETLSTTPAIAEACRRGWLTQIHEVPYAKSN